MSRCYVIVNQYCHGIQAGVQAAHAVAEMMWKHRDNPLTKQWVEKGRTLILLRGKGDDWMREKYNLLPNLILGGEDGLPRAYFEEGGLRDTMTAFAMILSDEILNFKDTRETVVYPTHPPRYVKQGFITDTQLKMLQVKEFVSQLQLAM